MHSQRSVVIVAMACLGLWLPELAWADNCGSFSDCFSSLRAALAALVGVGTFAALLSLALDFLPIIGTAKGILEFFTGRDLVTGEKLADWERWLGILPGLGVLTGGSVAAARAGRALDSLHDLSRVERGADHLGDMADAAGDTSRAGRSGGGPGGSGAGPPERPVHSRYGDGTLVFEGDQPPHITGPNPDALGSHTVLRHDTVNNRVYQGREFDPAGNPVRDIDFTNPTYPNGRPRPGHPGPPHQHPWRVNNPKVGPRSGFKRGRQEPLD